MLPVLSADQIRQVEDSFFAANPGVDLMSRAAEAVAGRARQLSKPGASMLVAVGPGNNGGDGLFAAAELARSGFRVYVWLASSKAHEQGLAAARSAGVIETVEPLAVAAEVDLVIDAVVGIGGRPGLAEPVAALARECADVGVTVLAVDVPSGLDADSQGVVGEHFQASHTVTFAALKTCHVAQPAAGVCGQVDVVDIGLKLPSCRVHVFTPADIGLHWPWPSATSDKYSRGVVGLDVGSPRYPGAALLSALGALNSGAGMIRYIGQADAAPILTRMPSITFGPGRVQAYVAGSGWDDQDAARLARLAGDGVPIVVDAGAIQMVPKVKLPEGCLLTPHAGELAGLLGKQRHEVVADPIGQARQGAERFGVCVLLKGATQYCVRPDGEVLVGLGGPHWSAQAGSGDVLGGICGTLLAAGVDPWRAGAMAASVQALAAGSAPGPYPPDRVAQSLPATISGLDLLGVSGRVQTIRAGRREPSRMESR